MEKMNEAGNLLPQVFNYTSKPIRVKIFDSQPWFIARDICEVLELKDTGRAIQNLDEDEKLTGKVFVSGQSRKMWLINESGLYNLVFRSTKPSAKTFRKWVTSEVLPRIREKGIFATVEPIGGVYPLIYNGQVGYPRRELLKAAGYSPSSGMVSTLKKRFPTHFLNICRVACLSPEFAKLRYKQGEVRQLQLRFFSNNALQGGLL